MHVNTVSELQAALTTLSTGRDITDVVVSDSTHQLGLEIFLQNDSILILSSGTPEPAQTVSGAKKGLRDRKCLLRGSNHLKSGPLPTSMPTAFTDNEDDARDARFESLRLRNIYGECVVVGRNLGNGLPFLKGKTNYLSFGVIAHSMETLIL